MSRYRFRPWMALAAVLLLLVVAFFGTFFIYGGTGFQSSAAKLAGSAVSPVIAGTHSFTASVGDFFKRLFALREVDKNYNDLKTQVQRLQVENQFMQDLQQENEKLNKLLGAKEQQYPDFTCLPASVIGKDAGSNWFMDFTLNRGASDGVKVDMNVVNEEGLVGRVVEVGHHWCKVMSIIDPQSAVSAVIERSQDFGMVCGSSDPQASVPTCGIFYLASTSDIVPGDKMDTSELGGKFLKGINVGTVGSVGKDENGDLVAELNPAVNFAHVEDVLIITSDQKIPTASDIAVEESQQANPTNTPGTQPTKSASTEPTASPSAQPTKSSEAGN